MQACPALSSDTADVAECRVKAIEGTAEKKVDDTATLIRLEGEVGCSMYLPAEIQNDADSCFGLGCADRRTLPVAP